MGFWIRITVLISVDKTKGCNLVHNYTFRPDKESLILCFCITLKVHIFKESLGSKLMDIMVVIL